MRRLQVFQLFQNEKMDVLMLQETRANQSSEDERCKIFKGCLFFSSASHSVSFQPGVAVTPSDFSLKILHHSSSED